MMRKFIYQKIKDKIGDNPLTDAHRHGLYDIGKIKGLKNLSVEEWSQNSEFISYQENTKLLYGEKLRKELKDWIQFSSKENIGTVLDFSAKHASNDLQTIYKTVNIKNFITLKWNKILGITMQTIPDYIILPDERLLSKNIILEAKKISVQYPTIKFTMHCLESEERRKIALGKFGMSTIEWLNHNNFLSDKLLLVHVNELSNNDIQLIIKNRVKIVLCSLMRKPLNYQNPLIPLDLEFYFGTDAPLISGSRSLIDVAVEQALVWIENGVDIEKSISFVSTGLVREL